MNFDRLTSQVESLMLELKSVLLEEERLKSLGEILTQGESNLRKKIQEFEEKVRVWGKEKDKVEAEKKYILMLVAETNAKQKAAENQKLEFSRRENELGRRESELENKEIDINALQTREKHLEEQQEKLELQMKLIEREKAIDKERKLSLEMRERAIEIKQNRIQAIVGE